MQDTQKDKLVCREMHIPSFWDLPHGWRQRNSGYLPATQGRAQVTDRSQNYHQHHPLEPIDRRRSYFFSDHVTVRLTRRPKALPVQSVSDSDISCWLYCQNGDLALTSEQSPRGASMCTIKRLVCRTQQVPTLWLRLVQGTCALLMYQSIRCRDFWLAYRHVP